MPSTCPVTGWPTPATRPHCSAGWATLARSTRWSFDPGPLAGTLPGDVLAPVLARADWVTCNARESALLTGAADPGDALRALTGRLPRAGVLVRVGPDGCLLGGRGVVTEHVPGFGVEVVDTNGAGDTHTGAFLAAVASGASWSEAVRRANGAAALSVAGAGPRPGRPRPNWSGFCPYRAWVAEGLTRPGPG